MPFVAEGSRPAGRSRVEEESPPLEFATRSPRDPPPRRGVPGRAVRGPYLDPETAHFYVRYGTTGWSLRDPYGPERRWCGDGLLRPGRAPRSRPHARLLELNHTSPSALLAGRPRHLPLPHAVRPRPRARRPAQRHLRRRQHLRRYDDRIVALRRQTALDGIRDTGARSVAPASCDPRHRTRDDDQRRRAAAARPLRQVAVTPLASNRKARHDYEVLETWRRRAAGRHRGQSSRQGRVQLKDSYVDLRDGQAFLVARTSAPTSRQPREPRARAAGASCCCTARDRPPLRPGAKQKGYRGAARDLLKGRG